MGAAQARLDTLTDPAEAFYAGLARSSLHSMRGVWALAQDDTYRTRICEGDLTSFRESRQSRCHG